jgi:hypothetical protein
VAERLRVHQDTVTRLLPDGLAAAVLEWGGRGKAMAFDSLLVDRWDHARNCRRRDGRKCSTCCTVTEDCQITGEHLIAEQHGHGECEMCDSMTLKAGCGV